MGELSKGSGISSIRGGDFELGASGVSAVASSDVVVEDITPLTLIPLEDDLRLVLGTGSATFTRSTAATFVDRNDGLVKTAAIDAVRFETNGALIEGASTNLLLRSEEFDNAAWTQVRLTVTADDTTAPDGTTTADKLTVDSTASATHTVLTVASVVFTAGNTYTKSIFAKAGNGSGAGRFLLLETDSFVRWSNDGHVRFDLVNGVVQGGAGLVFSNGNFAMVDMENGWFRCSINMICDSTGGATQEVQMSDGSASTAFSGNGTDFIHVWGGQIEELPFASSYITTTSVEVTKTLGDLDILSGNIPAPTADYSVCMAAEVIGLDSSKTQTLYSVDGETSRKIVVNTTTGIVEATHGAVTSVSTTAMTAGVSIDICFVVDGTNQTLYINGVQEDQDVKGTVTGTATAVSIGNAAGLNQGFAHIKDFRIYDVELTADQVNAV